MMFILDPSRRAPSTIGLLSETGLPIRSDIDLRYLVSSSWSLNAMFDVSIGNTLWSMLILVSPMECMSSSISSARSVSSGPLLTRSLTTTYFSRSSCSGVTFSGASPIPMSSLAWFTRGFDSREDVVVVVISSIISWIMAMNWASSSKRSF